ncbi:copper resistance CopC family protein [Micromonospora sp. URMC 103]|uniref:copper resistance CopC family protein n=1 Tax=Micromonospora sp. URMC 103 TaxID=3423406 RepID=UPI003F1AD2E4
MRRHPPRPGRALSSLLALVLLAAVAILTPAAPAAAHGTLAMSMPASGAVVREPLAAVELYFTEKVAANAYFTVTAPGGGRVDQGWTYGSPRPLDKPVREYFLVNGKFEPREFTTGFPAVVTVAHLPAVGQYSVSYLSVASDGETVRGTMSFRYSGRVTAPPPGWTPPANQPDPALLAATEQHGAASSPTPAAPPVSPAPPAGAAPSTASGDEDGAAWMVWTGVALAIVVAVAGFVAWRRRPAPAARRPGRGPVPGAAPRRRSTGPGPRSARGAAGRGRTTGGAARTGSAGAVDTSGGPAAPPQTRPGTTRLALLVGGLVVALLAGFGLGRVGAGGERTPGDRADVPAGPVSAVGPASAEDGHQHPPGTGAHTHAGDGGAGGGQATGTTVSAGGYTLQPMERSQPAGVSVDYRFRIVGTDRKPATRFAVVHDKPLHLIVVGRDLSGYQHLHPTMAPDGTWSVALRLGRAGPYRVYADFAVTNTDGTNLPLVLGVDHDVPGAHAPAPLPPAQPQATAGPFAVSMEGTPTVGVTVPMVFRVARTGADAPPRLERYLGAYGHLVVVREGDLGYVHVHPEPELVDGTVKFWLTVPSAGRYRAYFDFQVDGAVHTAEYTVNVT